MNVTVRPALGAALRAALRVAEREVRFFLLTWKGVTFSLFGAPILYLMALGFGLGGLVADGADLGGLSYLAFITPGVVVGAAAQNAAAGSLWPIMAGHRWIGHFRAMVTTPLAPADLVAGHLGWIAVQAATQAVVVLAAALVLGGVASPRALLAVPVVAATAMALAAPLMAHAAGRDTDATFDPLVRLVVTPLYLFSGAFFPTTSLPAALEWLARAAPLWHGVVLARAATTGRSVPVWLAGSTGLSLAASGAVLALWVWLGWWWARRAFDRRLTP